MFTKSNIVAQLGWIRIGLLAVTLIAGLSRLVYVTQSPPGFYVDEAAINAQVLCLSQSGRNLQGESFPLFSSALGGGMVTPTYLYPAAIWAYIFGGEIQSFRLFTALASIIFLIGVFVFAKRFWQSTTAAVLAALSASISPWVFQFARIAWDPALAPVYLVWALATLWGKTRRELALSGLLFSLAAYSYPPLRLQIALILPAAMIYFFSRKISLRPFWITFATAIVTSLPLIERSISGELQGRFEQIGVFNAEYLIRTFGEDSLANALIAIYNNLILLISPAYLFLSGDSNLRHSTGSFGILSWLDIFALGGILIIGILRRNKMQLNSFPEAALLFVGYFAGILPAAMTWESNPHALRSIGATTFLFIGVGGALAKIHEFHRMLKIVTLVVATFFFAVFLITYMRDYPQRAKAWFDAEIEQTAARMRREARPHELTSELTKAAIQYDLTALTYYGLRDGYLSCKTPKND